MLYFLLGFLAPIILNLIHLVFGIYVVINRGNLYSLGFTGMGFLTKTVGMLWFFTHIVEAFVIQHYMEENVPEWLQNLQIK